MEIQDKREQNSIENEPHRLNRLLPISSYVGIWVTP